MCKEYHYESSEIMPVSNHVLYLLTLTAATYDFIGSENLQHLGKNKRTSACD